MDNYLSRTLAKAVSLLPNVPEVLILEGMAGVGKTTLAQTLFPDLPLADLSDLTARSLATTAPADFFSVYGKRLIIDNADIAPEIMDFIPTDARVVLIGNFKGSDKARLAGRDAKTFTLMPLSFKETRGANPKPFAKDPVPLKITYPAPDFFETVRLGFLPRSSSSVFSGGFYEKWLTQFFEQVLVRKYHVEKLNPFMVFLRALAASSAKEINHYRLAQEAGISYRTAIYWARYLIDEGVILEIPSLVTSVRRQIKRAKIVFADSGLACALLNITHTESLLESPYYEQIIEGWAASEIIKSYRAWGEEASLYYYRDTSFKSVPFVLKTSYGFVPILFMSAKADDASRRLREARVLSRIGLKVADPVFLTDGSVTPASTDYALIALTDIG